MDKKKKTLKNTRLMGYTIAAEYCREHHIKGGDAIYAKDYLKKKVEIISLKYLKVITDDSLTWTEHIDSLCRKLSAGLYVICRMKYIINTVTAKTAYHALYESHLRYGIADWVGTTHSLLPNYCVPVHKLNSTEKKANVCNSETVEHTSITAEEDEPTTVWTSAECLA
ncbi:hypothetical protein J6590_069305 [Homalodisca vitripennis]|nr:hypothetical protein J6590_069305 [Homalodisca vitripennis]